MLDETRKQLLMAMGFSEKAIQILDNKTNMGAMDNPTVKAQHQGTCGDILMLSMKVSEDIIEDAQYEYIGCAGLQSCASALTEMIKGKTLDEASAFEVQDIIEYLQGIPQQKYECAEIAHEALRKAVEELKH